MAPNRGEMMKSWRNILSHHLLMGTTILLMIFSGTLLVAQRRAVVVDIEGEVDRGMFLFVSRALSSISDSEEEPPVLVLQVSTHGGRIDMATEIRDAILAYPGPSIAYVNPRAISAGALISLAADKIIMAPGSSIGAVTPVTGTGEEASRKVVSYMRGEMRGTAEQRGRDPLIAEAMVDKEFKLDESYPFFERRPLTLTTREAVEIGFVDGSAGSIEEALEKSGFPDLTIESLEPNASESFLDFLNHPIMNSILIMIGLGGLFFAVKTGHAGIGLLIGLASLALFFTSQYVVDLTNLIEMIIFVAGLLLLAAEIFVVPGFGVVGISGLLLMITGLFLALVGSLDVLEVADVTQPLYTLAGAFAGFFVLAWAMYKYLPHSSRFRKFSLLGESVSTSTGVPYSAEDLSGFIGRVGQVVSTLRPAGVVRFGEESVDVVSESGLVRSGEEVIVTSVVGRRVVVSPTASGEEASA